MISPWTWVVSGRDGKKKVDEFDRQEVKPTELGDRLDT
jgi:hypothetical protein